MGVINPVDVRCSDVDNCLICHPLSIHVHLNRLLVYIYTVHMFDIV